MNPIAILAVLVGIVAVATALGLVWRATTGRVRSVANDDDIVDVDRLTDAAPGAPLAAGTGATLLQFSTEVCAPCATTHALLDRIAAELVGVTHVDVDVTRRPDIASRFNLLQSPTTLVLDSRGVVRARIGGAPRPAEVRAELDRILAAA
jgi:thiol-disulfide isomerase/thioredoxin